MRYYSKTPDDPDTWGAVGSAGARFARPAPLHTLTKPARQTRKAVRDFAAERNARRAALAEQAVEAHVADRAARLDLEDLTGSPKRLLGRLVDAGAQVAATRSRDGQRLSVWAVTTDGRRVRALYKRTATGWGSDGVLIDGRAAGVTAALAELEGDRAMPR